MKQDITYETKVRKEEMSSVHMPYYIKSFSEIMEQRILKDIFDSIHTKIERPEDGDHIIIKTTITVDLPEVEKSVDRYVDGKITKDEYDFLIDKHNELYLHELCDRTYTIMESFDRHVGGHVLFDESKNLPLDIYEDVSAQIEKVNDELYNLYYLLGSLRFIGEVVKTINEVQGECNHELLMGTFNDFEK